METYAVFLRGINVGGITITMADLKKALVACGFAPVTTLLASGNVVLSSELDAGAVKEACERCLRAAFGYDAWVVVLGAARVAELVAACPYPADDPTTHSYITLSSDPLVLQELFDSSAALGGTDQALLGPEAVAWRAPAGGTLDVPFSKLSAKARYKAATTTRNLRTLVKVSAAVNMNAEQ